MTRPGRAAPLLLLLLPALATGAGCGRRLLGKLRTDGSAGVMLPDSAASDASTPDPARDAAPDLPGDSPEDRAAAVERPGERPSVDSADGAGASLDAAHGDGGFPLEGGGGGAVPPSKPPGLGAWEPNPGDPAARITAAAFGTSFNLVGFSNGALFLQSRGQAGPAADASAEVTWLRLDDRPIQVGGPTPRMAITAIALDERPSPPAIFVGYTAPAVVPKIWSSANGGQGWVELAAAPEHDVLALSLSPFNHDHLVAVTRDGTFVTYSRGQLWDPYYPDALNINFPGGVQALAEGVGASRRAWLGDTAGGLHYVDNLDAISDPKLISWTRLPAPFPQRSIIGIGVDRDRPTQLWVTLQGASVDGVWFTPDNGATWVARQQAMLPRDELGEVAPTMTFSFTRATPHPFFPIVYLTVLAPDTPAAFFTVDEGRSWWPQ